MFVLSDKEMSRDFAARIGAYLKQARRARRLRIRQLATRELPASLLRSVEKGTHPLTPLLVAEVAARYGTDLARVLPPRDRLVLLATGTICAGGLEEVFDPGDLDSVLDAYLRLVARLRGSDGAVTTLRRDDLIDIADQVGLPRTDVVARVAARLGANDGQRRAMVELYLAGADVVGIAA